MEFHYNKPFALEWGAILPSYHLAYTTHGRLNAAGDNVVWVFHALTANSDPAEWWPGLVGTARLFDPSDYFIVCVNMPGSCYGSIGPLDARPADPAPKDGLPKRPGAAAGEPYYHDFPFFTPRDMVRAYQPLREALGIRSIHTGIGGSMGGQQLLEWAIEEPGLFRHIVPIATNASHSSWGIAFNTAQRMAIEADASFAERRPDAGLAGMRAARAAALLSYRNYTAYALLQPRPDTFLTENPPPYGPSGSSPAAEPSARNGAASYQRYQGEKLARRFNAFSYYILSLSMDSHDLGRGRGGIEKALQKIRAKTLVIGIESDILFPVSEQQTLAAKIPGARYRQIGSLYGHDGFLLEFAQIESLVREWTGARMAKI